jgi:hypothetical protein
MGAIAASSSANVNADDRGKGLRTLEEQRKPPSARRITGDPEKSGKMDGSLKRLVTFSGANGFFKSGLNNCDGHGAT